MTTKSIVYKELMEAGLDEKYVSGEKLSEICGVSRTAVWKAVNALRKEGKTVEAVTNKGYRIAFSDNLTEELIRFFLPENFTPAITVFPIIDSTSTQAKKKCTEAGSFRSENGNLTAEGKKIHRSVIVAEEQTAGRGRQGRKFYSPKNRGIYLSIIYSPRNGIIRPAKMTAAAAVGMCRALKEVFNVEAEIKWVNDVFLNGKKICGILTEGISDFETGTIQAAVIGIGLNICNAEENMPDEVKRVAASVLSDSTKRYSRSRIAAAIIKNVLNIYDKEESSVSYTDEVFDEYKRRSFIIGRKVNVRPLAGTETESYDAQVIDIDNTAALVVKTDSGEIKHLESGEITVQSENFV